MTALSPNRKGVIAIGAEISDQESLECVHVS